jgi:hypothetical protein
MGDRSMTLPNQIGLDGDVTPPEYVGAMKLPPAFEPRVIFDRFGIKIEKRRHYKYGPETQIVVRLPLPRRTWFDAAYDTLGTAKPAWFIAFGMVECARTGWHARGQIIPLDFVADPPPEKELGYKNPINLANY